MDSVKQYKGDALLGALGAFLMLAGDLCLIVIPVSPGDNSCGRRNLCSHGGSAASVYRQPC